MVQDMRPPTADVKTRDCPMYRPSTESDLCLRCGGTRFDHHWASRRYYNDPETRAFHEYARTAPWWHVVIGWVLLICFIPVALIARLFGWRPK